MTATENPDDDPPKLPEGKELETVCRMVDIREYLPMIDAARKPENALKFVEAVLRDNPHYFKRIFQSIAMTAWEGDVRTLIAAGEKIQAIKLTREKTGWGLKESKIFCDEIGDGRR